MNDKSDTPDIAARSLFSTTDKCPVTSTPLTVESLRRVFSESRTANDDGPSFKDLYYGKWETLIPVDVYCERDPDYECQFQQDPNEADEKSYHYWRWCRNCNHCQWSLHSPRELKQDACHKCGTRLPHIP